MFKRFTLKAKFNLLSISLILLTAIGITLFLISVELKTNYQSLIDRGTEIASIAARNSEYAIYTENEDELKQVIDGLLANEDLVYAAILGRQQQLLSERGHLLRGQILNEPVLRTIGPSFAAPRTPTEKRSAAVSEYTDPMTGERYIVLFMPVITSDDRESEALVLNLAANVNAQSRPIGYIRIGISQHRMRAETLSFIRSAMIITIPIAILGLALTLLTTRRITFPLLTLVEATREISRDNFDCRLPVNSKDEIGDLASSFNDMTQQLGEYRLRVQEHTVQLADKNRALEQANDDAVAARGQAEQASEAKSLFLATMSHEIRTPLNGVLGMTEILGQTPLTPDQIRFLSIISESGRHLLSTINDILDFSKIEAGKLELNLSDFNLRELVEDVSFLFAGVAQSKGLELVSEIPPELAMQVHGDLIRLRQILTNLLGNSIKFTDSGTVIIRLSVQEKSENKARIRFEIEDTGIGIALAERQKIFESFTQADTSAARKHGGTGLGLAISNQLVELMAGEIGVDSAPGKGSRFWFEVWLKFDALPEQSGPMARASLQDLKVLIVDDLSINREILQHQLDVWHMQYRLSASGREALQVLRIAQEQGEPFDIAIIDYHMPEMDGMQLAHTITADEKLSGLPMMMLSSVADCGSNQAMQDAGIGYHLTKPIRQSDLYAGLATVMSNGPGKPTTLIKRKMDKKNRLALPTARVLIAEDSLANQEVVRLMVESLNCQPTVVGDGRMAVKAFSRECYDVILMDCHMPEMDGYRATTAIRRLEQKMGATKGIPIIALTADVIEGAHEKCTKAGMDDYLCKPYTKQQLYQALSRWLPKQTPFPNEACADNTADIADADEVIDQHALDKIRQVQKNTDSNALERVIGFYFTEAPGLVNSIRQAFNKNDSQNMAASAHKFKSCSANLGAVRLAKLCKELEVMAKEDQVKDAEALIALIDKEYQIVKQALALEQQRASNIIHPAVERTDCLVLVVDDDLAVCFMVRQVLQSHGFKVVEATNGRDGINTFKQLQPDAVLLDIEMPVEDGLSVCAKIRKSRNGQHIPVLMITAADDQVSIDRAYDAGATDFLVKPINWPNLGHHLRYLLRASKAIEAVAIAEKQAARLGRAIESSSSEIYVMDAKSLNFLQANRQACCNLGYSSQQLIELTLFDLKPELMPDQRQALSTLANGSDKAEIELHTSLQRQDGTRYPVDARLLLCNEEDSPVVIAIVQDITQRQAMEERLRYLAHHDSLTGLPNRQLFYESLDKILLHLVRSDRYSTSILFIDLDGFKRVNDSLGHSWGDRLLKRVAKLIVSCVRESDMSCLHIESESFSGVSRLGGDEFTVVLTHLSDKHIAEQVAERILKVLNQPIELDGHTILITPSIGIAVAPEDGEDVDSLLMNADTAMYYAKDSGRNNYQYYRGSMNARTLEALELESNLSQALERKEFVLYYQPLVNIDSGEIVAVEALIRWQRPDVGMLPPDTFIPIAEKTGLINSIGVWVLNQACWQNKHWQAAGLPPIKMAVNLSSQQFKQADLVQTINKTLANTGMDAKFLELELTESSIMEQADLTITTLNELKNIGVQLSVDDFGTGYSSLSYLKRFPLDTLKIDKSFVKDLSVDKDCALIVKATIALAKSLGLNVVAEGIETKEQLEYLRQHGADIGQGYLWSRPVDAQSFEKLLIQKNVELANSPLLTR